MNARVQGARQRSRNLTDQDPGVSARRQEGAVIGRFAGEFAAAEAHYLAALALKQDFPEARANFAKFFFDFEPNMDIRWQDIVHAT